MSHTLPSSTYLDNTPVASQPPSCLTSVQSEVFLLTVAVINIRQSPFAVPQADASSRRRRDRAAGMDDEHHGSNDWGVQPGIERHARLTYIEKTIQAAESGELPVGL